MNDCFFVQNQDSLLDEFFFSVTINRKVKSIAHMDLNKPVIEELEYDLYERNILLLVSY